MSGRSAASAAHLPCREGCTFPHPAGAHHPGAPSVRSASHRGGSRPAQTAGGTGRQDSRVATSRGHRQGVSGAAAAECGPRTDPVPCGTGGLLRAADLPPTEGRISLEGGKLPDQALECQDVHGCWRGRPPTIVDAIVKEPIRLVRLQRPWRLHRVGGLIGRPGRWSPGLYPVPTVPPAPPCKFLGSPGG
jgi:hypothetical protein